MISTRRNVLLLGGSVVPFSLAGCLRSAEKPPKLPVFGYNAGGQEHAIRVTVSGPGSTSVEGLPRSNTRVLRPTETTLLETAQRDDFELAVYFEDSGTRGSTDELEVRSGTETYSRSGYLAVVYDEPVGGEYVHLETLPVAPE